ncbi:MAG: glycosyltransferase family 1 protein [Caldilinea sp. CFX5]|nr:glycosyltransferase family 1 protein [Caldilinea sp. CFX5]
MKIGYLMQTGAANLLARPLSGPSNHVKHVCQELTALGHEVSLLMKVAGRLWYTTDLEYFTPVIAPQTALGLRQWSQRLVQRTQSALHLPYAAYFEALAFAQAIAQVMGDCDLFYERMGWMAYGGALAARRRGVPLVLEVNGDQWQELEILGAAPQGAQKWLALRIMRRMIHSTAHVVATGDGWRTGFIERWGVAPGKVSAVENGSELVTLLDREQLRAFSANPPTAAVTLVYVGAFEPWHGLRVLLNATARARQQGATVKLYLLGAGPEQANLARQVQELHLQDVVAMPGFVDMPTMAAYLAQADIGVCPYCGRVEYSGLKLLDYKAAGLATIASGANGQPVVLRQGVTGLIVPPCDEERLAAAIVALSRDHDLRRQMGRTARLEAEEQHSWRNTAQRLDAIFQRLTHPQPRYYLEGNPPSVTVSSRTMLH